MQKGIWAARMLTAQRAILASVEKAVVSGELDSKYLDGIRIAQATKQPDVRQLKELEAVADALEALNATQPAQPAAAFSSDEILAIKGLTKTSTEALESFFDSQTVEPETVEPETVEPETVGDDAPPD